MTEAAISSGSGGVTDDKKPDVFREGWLILALLLLFAALGFLFSYTNPLIVAFGVVAIVGGIIAVWAYLHYPVGSLAIVLLAQLLLPVYVRLPTPGVPLPPALLLMVAIIGLAFLTRMLRPIKSVISREEKMLATAMLIYSGALIFTTILGGSPPASISMWVKTSLIPVCFFFIFLRTVKNRHDVTVVLNVLLVAAVICGLFAIQEFITKNNAVANFFAPDVTIEEDFFLWYLVNGRKNPGGEIWRVFSFFTQPLEFSAFMIMTLPFAMLGFIESKSVRKKLLYAAAALAVFSGFAVTFSRGPTLALALTIIILSIYERQLRTWLAAGFVLSCIALAMAWPVIGQAIIDRLQGSRNISLRLHLWENGLTIFRDNPFFGIGYGAYPSQHAATIQSNQIGPMYEFHWQHIERVTTLENIYVTLAAEAGLLGLSCLFLVLGVYFYLFSRVMKLCKDQRSRTLALASLGAVLTYFLSGLTVANIIGYTISILCFGVYIPLMVVLLRRNDELSTSSAVSAMKSG